MVVVDLGSEQLRPRRCWPIVAAAGWNVLLIIVAIASGSVVRNDRPGVPLFVSLGGTVLLISSLAGLLVTLLVWALLAHHDRTGSRRSLLSARILAGLVVGTGVTTVDAFVGLFLLPTGALLLACATRRSSEPASAGKWYPAAT